MLRRALIPTVLALSLSSETESSGVGKPEREVV